MEKTDHLKSGDWVLVRDTSSSVTSHKVCCVVSATAKTATVEEWYANRPAFSCRKSAGDIVGQFRDEQVAKLAHSRMVSAAALRDEQRRAASNRYVKTVEALVDPVPA